MKTRNFEKEIIKFYITWEFWRRQATYFKKLTTLREKTTNFNKTDHLFSAHSSLAFLKMHKSGFYPSMVSFVFRQFVTTAFLGGSSIISSRCFDVAMDHVIDANFKRETRRQLPK